MNGIKFKLLRYSIRYGKYGDERKFKAYQSVEYFEDPTREDLATIKMGYRRKTNINANWEYFKNKAKEQLSSEVGQSIYAQR